MINKFEIVYKNVKNLKISLNDKAEISVVSPIGVPKKEIIKLLNLKKDWIKKQQAKIFANKKYDYSLYSLENGDKVYFLGKEHSVKLIESKQNIVINKDDTLEFYLNKSVINNTSFKQQLLEEFYRDRADIIFNNLVSKYLKITKQDITKVVIKNMKTRWGSCNYVNKVINLSVSLILRDIKAIEYVVLHEIAHLTYPNHSKEFYNYIAIYMPDWKNREKILK